VDEEEVEEEEDGKEGGREDEGTEKAAEHPCVINVSVGSF